jgi:hypothetical protein
LRRQANPAPRQTIRALALARFAPTPPRTFKEIAVSDEAFDLSRTTPADEGPTWADLLGTWRLCRKRACQRGKRCRGEELACLKTNLRLLPESVQLWFVALMESKREGFSFDEAMARLEDSWPEQGYLEWRMAIDQPVTAPED